MRLGGQGFADGGGAGVQRQAGHGRLLGGGRRAAVGRARGGAGRASRGGAQRLAQDQQGGLEVAAQRRGLGISSEVGFQEQARGLQRPLDVGASHLGVQRDELGQHLHGGGPRRRREDLGAQGLVEIGHQGGQAALAGQGGAKGLGRGLGRGLGQERREAGLGGGFGRADPGRPLDRLSRIDRVGLHGALHLAQQLAALHAGDRAHGGKRRHLCGGGDRS